MNSPKSAPERSAIAFRLHLISGVLRAANWLPLSLNRNLGAMLGHITWLANGTLKRTTLANLTLCYPQLSEAERAKLGRASLLHTGRALTESAWVWLRDPATLVERSRIVAGKSLFDKALERNQGLIIATPHIGNWEACNIILTQNRPITYLYRPPRRAWLEPLFIRWRANFNAHPATLNTSGLREVLRQLKHGKMIGVLPDQEPDAIGGVFAPLFGVPANTMTLLQKLGTRGKAEVLFCVCERDPGEWFKRKPGWKFSFVEPEPDLLHSDPVIVRNRDE